MGGYDCQSSARQAGRYPSWPSSVTPGRTLIYSALDSANSTDFQRLQDWYAHLPGLVEEGKIKPQSLKKFEGGMEALGEALDYLKSGKVRREKVVLSWA